MVFSSQIFLFLFLPLCLFFYYLTSHKYRNFILLFFSLIFYIWAETQYAWLIAASILFNYVLGILLFKSDRRKLILATGVFINILALFFYKYAGFFNVVLDIKSDYFHKIVLPLGISFYTFHSISYLVDIYRGKASPQTNLIKMGLYIVNFSQLVAGPIIRYHDVEKQLSFRTHIWNKFRNGIRLFIYGLAKKMIIANTLGIMADVVFDKSYGSYSSVYAWIGVLAYTLQIYFDFSGYSDMAIGLGKMFGFDFKPNFNLPYAATSIRDFWQKWHISLSSWFRDYVYIPLGGNRHGNARTAFNLLLVFLLCGFWHGASFTFIVWGLYHGLFLIIERVLANSLFSKIPKLIKHMYVWIVVLFGWVFFRSNTIDDSILMIKKMLCMLPADITMPDVKSFATPYFAIIAVSGIIISLGLVSKACLFSIKHKFITITTYRYAESLLLLALLFWSVTELINNTYNPFIYYRF